MWHCWLFTSFWEPLYQRCEDPTIQYYPYVKTFLIYKHHHPEGNHRRWHLYTRNSIERSPFGYLVSFHPLISISVSSITGKNLQQLVSSLYQSFNDFIRHHRPKHLHHIIIVVPDRRMENFYLAVRDLWESSVLVDVMYKEPMREVLEATGMICKVVYLVSFSFSWQILKTLQPTRIY